MDFKILLLVLCITFVSVQGAIPSCCISTVQVGKRQLKRVEKVVVQKRGGLCDIDALVLHIRGKKLCAPLWQRKRLRDVNPSVF